MMKKQNPVNYRILETAYGPGIRHRDWDVNGAEATFAGARLCLFAGTTGQAAWCYYPLPGGGDTLQQLCFAVRRIGKDASLTIRFNSSDQKGQKAKGFAITLTRDRCEIRGEGQTLASLENGLRGMSGEQEVSLAFLAERFAIALNGQPVADGQIEEASQSNEGRLFVDLVDCDIDLSAFTESFIAAAEPAPEWEQGEELYRESFSSDNFAANWYVKGEAPTLKDDHFQFHHMSNAFVRQSFEGPLCCNMAIEPVITDNYISVVTDAITLWMAHSKEGNFLEAIEKAEGVGMNILLPHNLYWVDFGGTNNVTTRMRRNPGRRMIRQFIDRERLLVPGSRYNLTLVQNGPWVEYWVDGVPWIQAHDPNAHTRGHIGIRSFVADLIVHELSIYRIRQKQGGTS